MPGEQKLSIRNKRDIFSMRNRMVDISENFPVKKKKKDVLVEKKKQWNTFIQTTEYEEIFSENVSNQTKILH